jgi:hypothetical protein
MVMLNAFVAMNRLQLRENPGLPSIYAAGVKYQRERLRVGGVRRPERWKTLLEILASKRDDCEGLACARTAELQHAGTNARVYLKRVNPVLWHVLVRHPDGTMEDPSARLGMKGPG